MPAYSKYDVYAGRYRLEQLIGEGGFSEVWKAKDEMADDSIVALKIYAPQKGLDEYGIKQFRKEYSITYNLSHPNLMKVLHFDICDGSPYLVMPFFKMGSLATNLQKNGPLKERQIGMLMQQIGSALEELHSQEPPILHQDIKPDNILIRSDDWFVITDFGISSKTRHTLNKATASLNSLTIAYSPPEKFGRNPGSTEASDIFSFGVTLYEMCTGNIPWEGSGGQSMLLGAQIPDLPSSFPKELNKMVRSCMSLNPENRPSAKTLKNWGAFFLQKGYWKFSTKKTKKSSFSYLTTSLLVIIAIGLLGLFLFKDLAEEKWGAIAGNFSGGKSTADLPVVKANQEEKIPPLPEKPSPSEVSSVQKSQPKSKAKKRAESKTQKPETTEAKKQTKPKTSNLKTTEASVVAAAEETKTVKKKAKPSELQIILNEISDPDIPIEVRKELKKEVLTFCSDDSTTVLDFKEGELKQYSIADFLDALLNNPFGELDIEVIDTMEDENRKYKEIHTRSSFSNYNQG